MLNSLPLLPRSVSTCLACIRLSCMLCYPELTKVPLLLQEAVSRNLDPAVAYQIMSGVRTASCERGR